MNILITGITGFIGQHLAEFITKSYPSYNYMGLCRKMPTEDIAGIPTYHFNLATTDFSFIRAFKPDLIYHLAGSTSPSNTNNKEIFESNLYGTMRLLDNIQCPVIYTSTANIWGNYPHIKEECTTVYAASKKATEVLIESYVKTKKIPGAFCLRLPGVVGYNNHGLVAKVIDLVKNDKPLKFWNNCEKTYVYIQNVITALLCENPQYDFKIKTLSNKDTLSTADIVRIVSQEYNKEYRKITFEGKYFPGDIDYFHPHSNYNLILNSKAAIQRTCKDYIEREQ